MLLLTLYIMLNLLIMKSLIIFILIIMAFPSCKSQKENSKFVDLPSQPNKSRRPMIIGGGSVTMRAPAIIYKTSEDFYNKVPVTLNASKDRKSVV